MMVNLNIAKSPRKVILGTAAGAIIGTIFAEVFGIPLWTGLLLSSVLVVVYLLVSTYYVLLGISVVAVFHIFVIAGMESPLAALLVAAGLMMFFTLKPIRLHRS